MAEVSAGSSIDVQSIVSGLMDIERRPIKKLEAKTSITQSKISALGDLKSAIYKLESAARELAKPQTLAKFSATSSNEGVLDATVTTLDTIENHSIRVDKLATTHRLASQATYTSADEVVGAGTYHYEVGDQGFDITLEAGKDTLTDLKNAINRSASNTGLSASIIKVDDGYKFVLSAQKSGTSNAITADGSWDQISEASDATIFVDGIEIHPPSNTLKDVIPGITLELKSTGETELTTSADVDAMAESMESFAQAYNDLKDTMARLDAGKLKGEGISLSVESAIRNRFFGEYESAEGTMSSVFQFGLTFDKEGRLSVDRSKFENAIDDNFFGLHNFFTADDGFSAKLQDSLRELTKTGGVIEGRKSSYYKRIDTYERQTERLEIRMEAVRNRYLQTYSELDALLGSVSNTSNNLAQQLGSLTNNSRN
jgi:flagellar hook-associated protein 2